MRCTSHGIGEERSLGFACCHAICLSNLWPLSTLSSALNSTGDELFSI